MKKATINEVKQLGKMLRKVYHLVFLALIALLIVALLFSTPLINKQSNWYTSLNSFFLIYALGIIPFSLKRFYTKMNKLEKQDFSLGKKMQLYNQAFMQRLWWISSVSILNSALLLVTKEPSEMFMSLIAIVALFFCSTGENSICRDLNLLDTKEEKTT